MTAKKKTDDRPIVVDSDEIEEEGFIEHEPVTEFTDDHDHTVTESVRGPLHWWTLTDGTRVKAWQEPDSSWSIAHVNTEQKVIRQPGVRQGIYTVKSLDEANSVVLAFAAKAVPEADGDS